ncbi:DrmB family protein [Corynebacterium tuberculostearicum]|uniref:DrmB family protein n=2 Tax=Corynebacterium tuberculostearicum TaxID=38304 RepID=UPI0038D1334D
MVNAKIRRAQLVSPFGVGAMNVLIDGTSVITSGLDHWFDSPDTSKIDVGEFATRDWRLARRLKVEEFRLPPDYREDGDVDGAKNLRLRVPVARFPLWAFCPYCKSLEQGRPASRNQLRCKNPIHRGKRPVMAQVPFVTFCSDGHLDDFPFREWVHRARNPQCNGHLFLISKGNGLDNQIVRCGSEDPNAEYSGCGRSRSLANTMGMKDRAAGTTQLSDGLVDGDSLFTCSGRMPWLGDYIAEEGCHNNIRAALRGGGNVYFPRVESSIYIPQTHISLPPEAENVVRDDDFISDIQTSLDFLSGDLGRAVDFVLKRRRVSARVRESISTEEWREAIGSRLEATDSDSEIAESNDLEDEQEWRFPEYQIIREEPSDADLSAYDPGINSELRSHLGRVRAVDVLKETRALRGFTRGMGTSLPLEKGKQLLRRNRSEDNVWLPAYVVRGEGIYIELNEDKLRRWERDEFAVERTEAIQNHELRVAEQMGRKAAELSPRFVLIHTLAHILINQLVFDCGYSSASLRERLYVSDKECNSMGGLLVYTAAGDSDGTLGGLVRLAGKDELNRVLCTAIEEARWCSVDPICMETGAAGQGPNSCNLAACHACALVPETSCENFNKYLDRGLLIGTFEQPDKGFFSDMFGAV